MLWQAKACPRSKNYMIKNLNGDVLTTEAECLDHWAEHLQQFLNCPLPQGNDDLPNKPTSNDYTDVCIQPVIEAEVAAALKCLKMATALVSVPSQLNFLRLVGQALPTGLSISLMKSGLEKKCKVNGGVG